MDIKGVISANLAFGTQLITTYLSDLDDRELLVRPVRGASHAAFQLGHLILSEFNSMEALKAGFSPSLPQGFIEAHSKGKQAGADNESYCSKSEYLQRAAAQREATLELLASIPDDQLAAEGPVKMRSYAPTVAHVFLMQGIHQANHAGQLAVLRRYLAKPVLI